MALKGGVGRLFRAPPGVNYLDTGTLQAVGHLFGGVTVIGRAKESETSSGCQRQGGDTVTTLGNGGHRGDN